MQVTRHASARLTDELRHNRALVTVKVWRPDGVLAWTNRAQARIGRRFDMDGDLGQAVDERRRGRPHRPALRRRGRGRGAARLRPPARGLRADPLGRRAQRARRLRDLRRPEKPRAHARLAPAHDLDDRRRGAPGALGRAGPAGSRRLEDAHPPDAGAAPALARPARLLRAARGELARGDREPERDRRGKRPGHRRPLAARSARRPGDRSAARPDGAAARRAPLRLALPRHRQDRGARRDPRQARQARLLGVRPDEDALGRGRADRREVRAAARGGADHQAPPRALGRLGLSGRPRQRMRSRSRRRSSGSPTRGTR